MSENMVFDSNIKRWLGALDAYNKGDEPTCPICHKGNLDITARMKPNRIGFLSMTCPHCKLTGYFSRVEFSVDAKATLFS